MCLREKSTPFKTNGELGSKRAFSPRELDCLSKIRLSQNFMMREFMYCASAAAGGFSNAPENSELVVAGARALCDKVLEPLLEKFGKFGITFAYQSRKSLEHDLRESGHKFKPHSSSPHCYDRMTWGARPYARIDILPLCVEDGNVSKADYGRWIMMNLDVDLLMEWTRSNVFCISIAPYPRRIHLQWGRPSLGEPQQRVLVGREYWLEQFPRLSSAERPKHFPSATDGRMSWRPSDIERWDNMKLGETDIQESQPDSVEAGQRTPYSRPPFKD